MSHTACRLSRSLFGSVQEERVQDADSVWQQQQAHQQHSCTLDECFQFYTKEEQVPPRGGRSGAGPLAGWAGPLGGWSLTVPWLPLQLAQDDAWRCPHCQALQQGVVKLSLWTLPDILIIHLKRFCQVGERRNKLSTLVKFPLSGLDMAPHVAQRSTGPKGAPGPWPSWKQPACLPTSYPPDFLYDLYAVCNHQGSLQGGHYTGETASRPVATAATPVAVALASTCPGDSHPWDAELTRALCPSCPLTCCTPGTCQRADIGWSQVGGGNGKPVMPEFSDGIRYGRVVVGIWGERPSSSVMQPKAFSLSDLVFFHSPGDLQWGLTVKLGGTWRE